MAGATFGGTQTNPGGRMLEDGVTWQYEDGSTYVNPTAKHAQMSGADVLSILGAQGTASGQPAQVTHTPSTVSYSPAPAPAPTYAPPGQAAWGGSTPGPAPSPAPAPGAPAPAPGPGGMPTFNLANAPTSPATQWQVDPKQTVANQLAEVLAKDSPLMEQARTRALQNAQSRGLLNSSMAASAGEAAMIDAALPVAQADASTYARAGEFNAGQQNTFLRDSNQFSREGAMAGFNLAANNWMADQQLQRDLQRDSAAAARDAANQQTAIERDEAAENATLRRGYINALNGARDQYAEKFAAISSNTQMSSELKAETLASLKASYNTMIQNYAQLLGWDPASWLIATESTAPAPAPGAAPAPAPAPGSPGWTPDYGGSGA